MVDRVIATTSVADVKPLGDYGQRSWELITGTLQRQLTTEHAQLFAEPTESPAGVRWMSQAEGLIVPHSELPEAEATVIHERLATLSAEIETLADRFAAERDPAAQSLAIALRNALEVPNDTCIIAVGQQPVLVQWAHHLDIYDPPRGVLRRIITTPAKAAQAAAPVAAEPLHPATTPTAVAATLTQPPQADSWWMDLLWWLGWFLLAILLAILFWLALPACGIHGLKSFGPCAAGSETSRAPVIEDDDLDRQIRNLRRQIAESERACVATREVPNQSQPVEEKPSIEKIIREGDTKNLAGCWELQSDYTLYLGGDANRPVKVKDWEVCFDDQGGGQQTIRFENGEVCRGGVTSEFQGNQKLSITDVGDTPCQSSRTFGKVSRRQTQCTIDVSERAQCVSRDYNRRNEEGGSSVILKRQR